MKTDEKHLISIIATVFILIIICFGCVGLRSCPERVVVKSKKVYISEGDTTTYACWTKKPKYCYYYSGVFIQPDSLGLLKKISTPEKIEYKLAKAW